MKIEIWQSAIRLSGENKQIKTSKQQKNPSNQLMRWRKVAKAYHKLRKDPNFKILESALDEVQELKGKPVIT